MREYQILKDLLLNNDAFKSKVKHSIIHFKRGETILTLGETKPNFYFILEGQVRILILEGHFGAKGVTSPIVTNLGKYHTFGEFGLFDNSPSVSEVVAILETSVLEIDKTAFTDFLANNTHLGYQVMIELFEAMCAQLRRQNKNFYHLLNKDLNSK